MATFSAAALADILSLGTRVTFSAGDRLLGEGETSTHVFLLIQGLVKVTVDTQDGVPMLLAVRVAGDAVGELASLDGQPRLANVTAAGALFARRISRVDFAAMLRRHPEAALAVSSSVSAKLRWATRRRIDFGEHGVAVRLARLVIELARQHGHSVEHGFDVGLDLTQPELAALIGAAEPSVNRALSALRREGMLRPRYRGLVIVDLRRLLEFAHLPPDTAV